MWKRRRVLSSVLLIALGLAISSFAQTETAALSGRVTDPSGAFVPGARLEVINIDTNTTTVVETNDQGFYVVTNLRPGRYTIIVRKVGFKQVVSSGIELHVQDIIAHNFQLEVGSVIESITVEAGASLLQSESAPVDTVVDRNFVENMPLNGRSFHTLIQITPGVVLPKVTPNPFLSQGQFSVNGQRTNANYFTVDGVSANAGVSPGNSPNQHAVGGLPALTSFGGTNNLASVDAVEEFKIQTSTYAAEFGRQPGAQVSIVTRSGTNELHGAIFNYFRNDKLDATDWFSNNRGLGKSALRQNDFGGVIGGPIVRDRTFFFFSYEGLRLRLPQFLITEVPSVNARQMAAPGTKPLLDSFPIPNGADLGNEVAEFAGNFSTPSHLNATSLRVDHTWDKLSLFGRYNHATSGTNGRAFGRIHNEQVLRVKTQTFTFGATLVGTPNIINDFRLNWTRDRAKNLNRFVEIGGNSIPPDSALLPSFASLDRTFFGAFMGGPGTIVGANVTNLQRQINVVDALSAVKGTHHLKLGIDYRRLSPLYGEKPLDLIYVFAGVPGAVTGDALLALVSSHFSDNTYYVHNLSLYAQDTWRATPRLTLTYGLRWELNPAPSAKDGQLPFTVRGLDDPATMTLAPQGTRLWKTTYNNFAPRLGVAYHLSQERGIVLRGGVGLFYDLGSGTALLGGGAWPYLQDKFLFGVPFPLDDVSAEPPPFTTDPPYGFFYAFEPDLKLPYTVQWNVALEKALGPNQSISTTYVGSAGRRLTRVEVLRNPFCGCNPDFTFTNVTRDTATSDYHALQAQFQRRLSHGLQALVSYSWSHSIDDLSDESISGIPLELSTVNFPPTTEGASSDFDVRHSFSAAVTYQIPTPHTSDFARAMVGNWSIASIVRATSGTPLNILIGTDILRTGLSGVARPDLVPGEPVWISDSSVGGGRRINRDAFTAPSIARQGNLGRNALRGFDFFQIDFSLSRQFIFTERVNLQFRSDFFNIFNHPNFGDPITNLNSGLFGLSTQMLNNNLGSGGTLGGFSPLYNIGGPRSIQLALKLLF